MYEYVYIYVYVCVHRYFEEETFGSVWLLMTAILARLPS